MTVAQRPNYDLKEEIRGYWSDRSRSFDLDFGHKIAQGSEFDGWSAALRRLLGDQPLDILELACGTGEVTAVLTALGHRVTGLDFSEDMLAVAKRKHSANGRARFILADAEDSREPDGRYDAVVCRHLVWTLTDPDKAFAEWHRVLKPGGLVVFFDGNWAEPSRLGKITTKLIALIDRLSGQRPRGFSDDAGDMAARHTSIMRRLPFGAGLTPETVVPRLKQAGFETVEVHSHAAVTKAQRRGANLRNKLRTTVYDRFVIRCSKAL